jgi:hypothetical protein
MGQIRYAARSIVCVMTALMAAPVDATFHLWEIGEVYTNHNGSVQFIELFTSSSSQNQVDGEQIRATSDGMTKTFTFGGNIVGSTQNKTLLIATPGFSALPGGVAPNYGLPDPSMFGPFFDPDAATITINFVGADSVSFAGSALPKNGLDSLYFTATGVTSTGVNTPQNFAGADGSVNLPPPPTGDYNGDGIVDAADYTVWRKTDGSQGGYDTWRTNFGETVDSGSGTNVNATVPEPATLVMLIVTAAGVSTRRRWRTSRVSKLINA